MRQILLIALIAGLAVGPAACAVRPTGPTPSASPLQSPLVAPTAGPMVFPTPILPTPLSKDTATVGGVILREMDGRPLQGLTSGSLFLGKVYRDSNGRPVMAGLDSGKAPKTVATDSGQFIFKQVPVGTYALMFDSPGGGTVALKDPKTGDDLLIEIKGGEVINLGELRYSLPF